MTPNDLRRTFATWLEQNQVDFAVVAAVMGHSSTALKCGRGYRRQLAPTNTMFSALCTNSSSGNV